jgi:antirestriction protein ArdC
VLKNDRKLLVSAAAQAQKASDHILGLTPAKTTEEPVEAGRNAE